MRICLIHNEYGKTSGEEIAVRQLRDVLQQNGHPVTAYFRSSAELAGARAGSAKAFFTGIYNFSARSRMREILKDHTPDIVHVHNLYPLISPSILGECKRAGIPVVMTVHNYRLICPNGLHMVRGQVCERCSGGREYHCVLNRCEGSLLKSAGYALRGAVARKMKFYHDNVTLYAALTKFQQEKLVAAGYPVRRIVVVPNMTEPPMPVDPAPGQWVGYAGRLSHEKGIPTLIAAAQRLPDVRFKLAGSYDRMPELPRRIPPNVELLGHLHGDQLDEFYRGCRMVVLCSTWFEGFPMMLAEAMLRAKPLICSRVGGLPEIVADGQTGFLVTPGNVEELVSRIRLVWDDADLCRALGAAGREKAVTQYSPTRYYERILDAYGLAKELHASGN
jgi:glycosyltransferase involved in cell wall biosynthesis